MNTQGLKPFFTRLFLLCGLVMSAQTLPALEDRVQAPANGSAWRFRVYLDDREIGHHHFFLAEHGPLKQLRSVASFEYRLLFIPLFNYSHENMETWEGNCLQSIRSQTDSNGERFEVSGRRQSGLFYVERKEGTNSLPDCVMSFAYWNPDFLHQDALLNSQDGEYMTVEFSEPVYEELEIQGELRPTYRYRLAAGALNLDLWYSTENEWLALESEVGGGRTLRYVLEDTTQDAEPSVLKMAASGEGGESGPAGPGR